MGRGHRLQAPQDPDRVPGLGHGTASRWTMPVKQAGPTAARRYSETSKTAQATPWRSNIRRVSSKPAGMTTRRGPSVTKLPPRFLRPLFDRWGKHDAHACALEHRRATGQLRL